MTRHEIPTARYQTFAKSEEAIRYIKSEVTGPTVVKAWGLAAVKGVLMATTPAEAIRAVHDIIVRREFGDEGDEVVIEEMLQGDEISITLVTDGRTLKLFPVGQDAQRVYNGNLGPNTGGMGVYAPTPLLSSEKIEEVTRTILNPTIEGIKSEGHPFVGFICIGLMMTANGPKLIEYNARFGDPEAQTLLPMLEEDSDLAKVMISCTNQELELVNLRFKNKSAVSVVMASEGYPGPYQCGATAILRGFMYLLILQQPSLIQHVEKAYEYTGKQLFEGEGAVYRLSRALTSMLHDPLAKESYLIIDALDECERDRQQLLNFIAKNVSDFPVKWIVSSRYRGDIEQSLKQDDSRRRLNLELNEGHVTQDINTFIDYKVSELVSLKDDRQKQQKVHNGLRSKADGTFLWVDLVVR
ncbi:phosphoribosylamine-glycine ligase [Colletotrichum incanum]|uniref:Phosphoribosylamine-glycine ligase n=1 Tax=Colletotrichum incanum TaxID=1573173 RepID=A0A161YB00_COLIC|nr:phosphoribosylamine-glycine ligase [Colletotrichum incanum]